MKNISRSKSYLIVAAFWLAICLLWSTKTQAQSNLCDSLSYSIVTDSATWNTLMVTGNANGISNMVDSIDWNFTACNATACYIAQGNNPYSFPLIYPSDTVKLCYDAFVYTMGTTIMCNHCDSLIYDFMSDTWVVMLRNTSTGLPGFVIEEDGVRWFNNIIYDMFGRELTTAPIGVMYIRGGKKYIRTK